MKLINYLSDKGLIWSVRLLMLVLTVAGAELCAQDATLPSQNLTQWADPMSLETLPVERDFLLDETIYPMSLDDGVLGLGISGNIVLNGEDSLARVILIDDQLNEYLVFQAFPLISPAQPFSISNACTETCVLPVTTVSSLKIELINASIQIDSVTINPVTQIQPPMLALPADMAPLLEEIQQTQEAEMIELLNAQIEANGLRWVAGETSVSGLSYAEKKTLLGDVVASNLHGFEYYTGGIFEIPDIAQTVSAFAAESVFTESFDWRTRHGANNPDSPYYDGDETGGGWITSIKRQLCGDCWAHGAVGATEAVTNLYFNQHLDLDLSEQEMVSCSGAGNCSGGSPGIALMYIMNSGVVDETCFPESGTNESCANKCPVPVEQIMVNGYHDVNLASEDAIKGDIIEHGPIAFSIISWRHCMVAVGFQTDTVDGSPVWILKNSWGAGWGDNGYVYLKLPLSDLYYTSAIEGPVFSILKQRDIACHDMDGDGYYNWGLSLDKPATCPETSSDEKDCDDSDPGLGIWNADGSCVINSPVENLSTWNQLNGIEVTVLGDDSYQLTHPGTSWPILAKNVPIIPPGAQLKVSFTGLSGPAGARLTINPWSLSETGGGHIYLSDVESSYERIYTNTSDAAITDARLMFYFEDSQASGAGQTIDVKDLRFEILEENPTDYEDLTSWDSVNGIELQSIGNNQFQLTHPGSNWPILRKALPVIPTGSRLEISFTGHSIPAGARLVVNPWDLAVTDGGHIYFSDTQANYQRYYTNNTGADITDARLMFFFEDSEPSGAGQTINISNLHVEITSTQALTPTDDANNTASLDGLLAVSKWEHAYFRFDIRQIQHQITSAVLRVYDDGRNLPHTLFAAAVYEDDWSENSSSPVRTLIAHHPDLLLDTTEVMNMGYVEFDVTDFVARQIYDGYVTLEISSDQNTWSMLSSKEGLYIPELVIQTEEVLNQIQRISVSSEGIAANNGSSMGNITSSGRYTVFYSLASNLVDGDTSNNIDIFLRDLATGVTTRINSTTDGNEVNGWSTGPMISDNGRFIVFMSAATNLVDGDNNLLTDVFLYDQQTKNVQKINNVSYGLELNPWSYEPRISANGRFITFSTDSEAGLMLYDHESMEMEPVCVSSQGELANDYCKGGSMSGDGRFVVFYSTADNLVENDINGVSDIFIRDRTDKTTKIIKSELLTSTPPLVSQDGRFVAYSSYSDWLIVILLHNLEDGTEKIVSVSSDGVLGNGSAYLSSISANGRYISFASFATNLVEDDTNEKIDTFVHDSLSGKTIKIKPEGVEPNDHTVSSMISPDGRFIIFDSGATNFVEDDYNVAGDVFIAPVIFD